MDYSMFKPGDKVRSTSPRTNYSATGVVLFSNEKCLLVQHDDHELPTNYTSWEFEKIPERTSKFTNVFCGSHGKLLLSGHIQYTKSEALGRRDRALSYVGMFEQVFEDGKLVETKYHPD